MPNQTNVKATGKRAKAREEAAVEANRAKKADAAKLKDDIDEILDGIEDILEENAEAMVSQYRQAGGE